MDKKYKDLFAFFRAIGMIIAILIGFIFNAWLGSLVVIILVEILIYFYSKKVSLPK